MLISHEVLLCFHKPLPPVPSDLLKRENIGEWSVKKAAKTSSCFADSCKALDMKKQSIFLWIFFEYNQKSC